MNANVLLAATGSDDTPAGLGFVVLAAIVSFHTLLYVVLTVAKLIPWPRQPLPAEVRRGVKRIGLTIDEESVMSEIPLPRSPESDDPAEDRRLAAARQEVPQAFLLTGGLVMAFAVAVGVSRFSLDFRVHVLEFVTGVILLITGVVLGYSNLTGRRMSWIWALTAMVLVVLLVREGFEFDALTPRAYAVILMTAYMPITLSWRPAIIAGAGMSAGTVVVSVANLANGGAMLLLAPSALLVSSSLLHLRMRAFRSTAVELTHATALATTEPLTGLLNPRGLLTQVPRLADDAVRTGRKVHATSIEILDLDRATREYGAHYARDVRRTIATAIESLVRVSDLVGTWPDDEFIVVGLGDAANSTQLAARLEDQIRETGISLGRSPLRVRAGSAHGDPTTDTFEQILNEARTARGPATTRAREAR